MRAVIGSSAVDVLRSMRCGVASTVLAALNPWIRLVRHAHENPSKPAFCLMLGICPQLESLPEPKSLRLPDWRLFQVRRLASTPGELGPKSFMLHKILACCENTEQSICSAERLLLSTL